MKMRLTLIVSLIVFSIHSCYHIWRDKTLHETKAVTEWMQDVERKDIKLVLQQYGVFVAYGKEAFEAIHCYGNS